VRVARQVSHPNVCRVYDIGEVEGQPYISMEYVDGEDLRSLLRRIGRLPADKATEIARRLCAGLAAAHDKGVLHRDLKPANIMIDGQGKVLITDFGLAGIADQFAGGEVRAGTPAYMAPEQLAGKEVSAKSDIYALGLVLYEMFTGKRAFAANSLAEMARLQNESAPISPTSVVKDLDPAVERVILRCLQADPRSRPASALAVAAALPGGDPLAAALAAGETPSPEMVAAAGESEGMRVGWAVACLAAVLAGLALCVWLIPGTRLTGHVPLDTPPEALAHRAREFLGSFGYTDRGKDRAYGLADTSNAFTRYLEKHDRSRPWEHTIKQPALIRFWYRESPDYLVADKWFTAAFSLGQVSRYDPARGFPGMVLIDLDCAGRLVYLEASPPEFEQSPPSARFATWSSLFTAAGLDLTRFASADPQWTPPVACDVRSAWTGVFPDAPNYSLRVEAASWRGKPVYFNMIGPWTTPAAPYQWTTAQATVNGVFMIVFSVLIIGGLWLARRNVKLGRGDRNGAARIATLVFWVYLALWALDAHHVLYYSEFWLLGFAASYALFMAAMAWLFYMALEPFVRRHWPHTLIGWSRVLAGAYRDPLVGRDVLAGVAGGILCQLLFVVSLVADQRAGAAPSFPDSRSLEALLGVRHLAGLAVYQVPDSLIAALSFFLFFFLLRLVLRKDWLAGAVLIVIVTVVAALQGRSLAVDVAAAAISYGVLVWVLPRFGLLAIVTGFLANYAVLYFFVTSDFSAWYAESTICGLAIVVAMAAYGFHTTLAGRPLFKSELLSD